MKKNQFKIINHFNIVHSSFISSSFHIFTPSSLNPKMKIGFFFIHFISVNMIMRRQLQSMNNNNNNKECSGFFICCFCTRVLKFRGSLNASEYFGMNAKTLHYVFFFVSFFLFHSLFWYIFFVSSPHQRAFDIVYLVLYWRSFLLFRGFPHLNDFAIKFGVFSCFFMIIKFLFFS